MGLSPEAVAQFRANGFVVLRGALGAEEAAALRAEADAAVRDATGAGYRTAAPDNRDHYVPATGERTPLGLARFEHYAAVAAELLRQPVLPSMTQHILYFEGVGWHSDTGHALPSVKVVAYLEPLDADSGALRVKVDGEEHVLATVPGDLIVFDEHVEHASFNGCNRLQWSASYVADDGRDDAALARYLAGQFGVGGNLGYDVERYPYYGTHFRRTFPAVWVQRLDHLGAFAAAALEEQGHDPANRFIHTERVGTGEPRLVLIHGFTQTGRSWTRVAADLAADHEVVVTDAPGHGGSSNTIADLWTGAHYMADAASGNVYIGYSMGARFALTTALTRPSAVDGLVLLGVNPGIEDAAERAARARADGELAATIERDGVDDFLDRWLAQPLFASLPRDAADVEDRHRNTPAGLASSLRYAGTGRQEPVWDRVHNIRVPVLVLAGEHDTKFAAIGARLADAIGPNATFAVVPGAGHAAHLEQPDAFVAIVRPWLAQAVSQRPAANATPNTS
ncbi:MAG TPA: alpha/beta fold hydrolase [Acidimicrobiales bacterium]|nr:alpha/beta fold hydrolase [Acidimicrobiales bacterium]